MTLIQNRDFLNTMTSFGFLPCILQHTRITEFTSTINDNIYSNNFEQEGFGGNILIQFSDHLSQFLSIEKKIKRVKPADIYRHDLSDFDEQSFINDISIQNWNAHNLEGTDNKFNDFLWRIEDCLDRHAPVKKLSKKQQKKVSKPWINDTILKLISHRERLRHKSINNPINHRVKSAYKLFRNRVTREIRKAKCDYYQHFFEVNLNNMKNTWKGIKSILNLNNKNGSQITHFHTQIYIGS